MMSDCEGDCGDECSCELGRNKDVWGTKSEAGGLHFHFALGTGALDDDMIASAE